jgi:hypothetical protein
MISTLTKDPIDLNVSPGMQFSAERDGSSGELPITPVIPCEAFPMLELIRNRRPLAAATGQSEPANTFW